MRRVKPYADVEQIIGREGAHSDFVIALRGFPELVWRVFPPHPTSSQPFDGHYNQTMIPCRKPLKDAATAAGATLAAPMINRGRFSIFADSKFARN